MTSSEGFGQFDDKYASQLTDYRKTYRVEDCDKSGQVWQSRRVVFKQMFGLLNQEKLIPLRFCPLQIELELVNNGADAVFVNVEGADAKYTSNWDVTDIQCKLDLLELDSALSNEYTSHLLSGKSLPINFSTWNHTNQSTGGDKNFSAHINRALTRLKSVFITLHGVDDGRYKQANQFSTQLILNKMMLSRLMTSTSIGFKSVQKSSQNIL